MRSPGSLTLLLLLTLAPVAAGQSAAPDVKTWVQTVTGGAGKLPDARSLGAFATFAIVDGVKKNGSPRFFVFDHVAFNKLSYFQAYPPADAALAFMLNEVPTKDAGWESLARNVLAVLGVDAVLLVDKKAKTWKVAVRGAKGPEVVLEAPAPELVDSPTAFLEWLHRGLGYDSVVLAVKDGLVLAMSAKEHLDKQHQAVIFADSAGKVGLDAKTAKAEAIVEKVATWGSYAVFRSVIARGADSLGGTVKPGAKMLFSTDD